MITGDLCHHPIQFAHPDWSSEPDIDKPAAIETRRSFAERYCDDHTIVLGTHFGGPVVWTAARIGQRRLDARTPATTPTSPERPGAGRLADPTTRGTSMHSEDVDDLGLDLASVWRPLTTASGAIFAHWCSTATCSTIAAARGPSLLPGWTRGHVLTHIARHADSVIRALQGGGTRRRRRPLSRTARIAGAGDRRRRGSVRGRARGGRDRNQQKARRHD